MRPSHVIACAAVLLTLGPLRVNASIFSGAEGGLPHSNLLARGWISSVVSFEPGPVPGSGGAARDDAAAPTSISNAVVGRPADFTFGGVTRHYASLGNGGRITVTFDHPISDGPGPDFAVFENGFTDPTDWTGTQREGSPIAYFFAELASIEISSDQQHWARFPVQYLNNEPMYVATYAEANRFASQDVRGIDGLAGKHDLAQGTPFDLSALTNHPSVQSGQINLALVRYVRLTDVTGDGSFRDDQGRPVYDPYYDYEFDDLVAYPAYSTEGFDLRGIAVLNSGEAAAHLAGGVPMLACDGVKHTMYTIEHSVGPGMAWQPVGVLTGRGERVSWPMPANGSGFYRLRREAQTP